MTWIDDLQQHGQRPELVILETVSADPSVWRVAEATWAQRLLAAGHPLTNGTPECQPETPQQRDRRLFGEAAERGQEIAIALGVEPQELVKAS